MDSIRPSRAIGPTSPIRPSRAIGLSRPIGPGCPGSARQRRWIPILAARIVLAAVPSGCSRQVGVPRESMQPGTTLERSRVILAGGREYRFESVAFTPDSLLGRYRVSVETGSEREGGIRFEEVLRTYPVALAEVESVLVLERDVRKGVLYAAGAGAVAGLLYLVVADDDDDDDGSSGKPPRPIDL
jgi:hypothetical protein